MLICTPNIDFTAQNLVSGAAFLVNKPLGWTSFDVVNKIRYAAKRKTQLKRIKVGHAGTLDPLAEGLLIVCTGKATKQIQELQGLDKTYTGTITIGATRPSHDLETEINQKFDFSEITQEEVLKTAAGFVGKMHQLPPIFSAKKIDGKKAYDLARKGEIPEMKTKEIEIKKFQIYACELPQIDFLIECSSGTYIRSIAFDFGERLQNGGHLSALKRAAIGTYQLENAFELPALIERIDTCE